MIFRGCTRPALVIGVPIVPLVVSVAPILLVSVVLAWCLGIYAWIFAAAILVPMVVGLREITSVDDQRLLQWVHVLRLVADRRSWRARSHRHYSPVCQGHP